MTTQHLHADNESFGGGAAGLRQALRAVAAKGPYAALAIIFVWFGGMKFTGYAAHAIEGLVANSPLLSLLYNVLSVQGASVLIGTAEISIGLLLAGRFVSPKLSLAGAIGAGLFFAGVTGNCMLASLLARLPYNKRGADPAADGQLVQTA